MGSLVIQSVTVSVEVSDKTFGSGDSRFMSLKGRYEDGGIPASELDFVVLDSLDVFLAAWKSLLSSRFAQGNMTGEDFKKHLENTVVKTEKVRAYLRRLANEQRDGGAQV